jgi:uncharacterized membrane protein
MHDIFKIFEKNKRIFLSVLLLTLMFLSSLFVLSSHIVSAVQPFNIEIELPDSYRNVNPGSEVWFTIKLLNLDNLQRMDVTLSYDIVNSGSKSIIHNSKTVAIETQASFVASLKIPDNTPPGDYAIDLVVNSTLGESHARAALKVSNPETNWTIYYIAAAIVGIVLIVFLIIKSKPLIEKIKLKMKVDKIVRDKMKKK